MVAKLHLAPWLRRSLWPHQTSGEDRYRDEIALERTGPATSLGLCAPAARYVADHRSRHVTCSSVAHRCDYAFAGGSRLHLFYYLRQRIAVWQLVKERLPPLVVVIDI